MCSISNVQPCFNTELQIQARTSNASTGENYFPSQDQEGLSNFSLFEESIIILYLYLIVRALRVGGVSPDNTVIYHCPILAPYLHLLKLIKEEFKKLNKE